ncbi:MAG: hypothetical protein SGCHY_002737 [Lobulomycetales sp.]
MGLFAKTPEPASAVRKDLYKMGKVIGAGSYGRVKKAVVKATGEAVAVKSMYKRDNADPDSVAAIKREIDILTDLKHENVINLLDSFETNVKHYLVFELVTGGELFDRVVSDGMMTELDAAGIVYQILDGLAFIHEKGIVHRDLKPENILLRDTSPDAKVVIADFGVSNFIDEESALSTMCGSPAYIAPEVLRRKGHGAKVDIWAVGIITYSLLSGYHPFHYCEDMASLHRAIDRAEVEFEHTYWRNISTEAQAFISSLLARDPEKRPTAKEAKQHAWLVKYCRRARKDLKRIQRELLMHPNAGKTPEHKEPDAAAAAVVAVDDDEVPDKGLLPNLCSEWTYERTNLAPFNASRALKNAVNAVVGMNRLKLGASSTSLKD